MGPFMLLSVYGLDQKRPEGIVSAATSRATGCRRNLPDREVQLTAGGGNVIGAHRAGGHIDFKTSIAAEEVAIHGWVETHETGFHRHRLGSEDVSGGSALQVLCHRRPHRLIRSR